MSIYAKEFLAIYMAFNEFGHIFWGATKPVIIMTDSKSVTRFFQAKMIPPPLWNACDFVLQFNFTIAHIPGKRNTAADFLSRLEMDPNEKIILKLEKTFQQNRLKLTLNPQASHKKKRPFSILQTNKRPQKKKKPETPYLTIHQSSHCPATTQMTYTKTQQL